MSKTSDAVCAMLEALDQMHADPSPAGPAPGLFFCPRAVDPGPDRVLPFMDAACNRSTRLAELSPMKSVPRRCPRCGAEVFRPLPILDHEPQLDAEGSPTCAHWVSSDPDCLCGWRQVFRRYLGLHPYCPQAATGD